MERVVILGAGFGGLELATRLSEEVADKVEVTLIDQNDSFLFGYSKLDVMFGRHAIDDVRMYYRDIVKPSVEFRHEVVEAIDPENRHVRTNRAEYDADVLVIALGADLDPAATPGLLDDGYEFYSVPGAEQLREVLPAFKGGNVVVSVLGPFFKCPAAPFECAMLMHDLASRLDVSDDTDIKVISPLRSPIPISPEASAGILAGLARRGIEFWPEARVGRLDPATHVASLLDGRTLPYDLFLGIPVHTCPPVVVDAGMTVDGWVPVDHTTFATRYPNVYAVGDITSAPVPRVGVIAEGEAGTVADVLVHRLRGGDDPDAYKGIASCYIEFGSKEVARFDVNFLGGPAPFGAFAEPSLELAASKQEFGSSRRQRWFGS